MLALETAAPSPPSHSIVSASSACFACHQLSATTATASLSLTTLWTPFMPTALESSTDFSVPLNTGHCASAACSMPGTRTSMP